ncbi:MAG: hypothetical protein WBS19_20280 [Candidatus Korobacteraceae bacterium]
MASASPVILLFGNYRELLRSRTEILLSLGLCVFEAHNLCEAIELLEILEQARCDLVMLCHSIGETERQVFMDYLLMNFPWIKVEAVTPDDDKCLGHFREKLEAALGIGSPYRDSVLY